MANSFLQLDSLNSQNLQVMLAYIERAKVAKAASPEEFDGWLERIDRLPGCTSEELTQLHGQMIAMGFLKFEITGRSVGLRYQVSTRGKNAVERAVAQAERGELPDAQTPPSEDATDPVDFADDGDGHGLAEAA